MSIYDQVAQLFKRDIAVLMQKDKDYGSSWKRRGGAGAFMMAARKWDRIENIVVAAKYDVFAAGEANTGDILDDIADLRNYLFLIEAEIVQRKQSLIQQSNNKTRCFYGEQVTVKLDGSEPGAGYVNQG